MHLCIILPAYNEEHALGDLMSRISAAGYDYVVIDDGSTDSTAERARSAEAKIIQFPENQGKGAALRAGFAWCCDKGYEAVITLDTDGQHDPAEIPRFIAVAKATGAELVIGNRMGDTSTMPFIRRVTNRVMSALLSRMAGQSVPDTQCGYRLIHTSLLRTLKIETSRFEIESEVVLEAGRQGKQIASVPIKTIYQNAHSKINPVRDTVRFFQMLFHKKLKTKDQKSKTQIND